MKEHSTADIVIFNIKIEQSCKFHFTFSSGINPRQVSDSQG